LSTWKILLSACIDHDTKRAGKYAAKALEINPRDAHVYILLTNAHIKAKDLGAIEAVSIRRRVENPDKMNGKAWIEVNEQVTSFGAEPTTHPNWQEIQAYIKKQDAELKSHGYHTDTNCLRDMGEEQRDNSTNFHRYIDTFYCRSYWRS
jgi:hypothetical protein